MNFPRIIFPLVALFLGAGCAVTSTDRRPKNRQYYQVTENNLRGELVADWIAEGPVRPRGGGYRFAAVQRVTAPPYVTNARYPKGRTMLITGPHISIRPVEKPEWLRQYDGQ